MSRSIEVGAKTRRFWPYALAGAFILVSGFHSFCVTRSFVPLPRDFGREYFVEFEWDSVEGFKTFRVVGFNRSQVGGRLWQSLVTVQVKPLVDAYLKPSKLHSVKGGAMVFVTKLIPLTYPDSWGSDGFVVHQRTDIGLRQDNFITTAELDPE
jgi:hypothetical protein